MEPKSDKDGGGGGGTTNSTLEPNSQQQGEPPESNNATHMGFQQTVMYGEYSKALGELAKKEARDDVADQPDVLVEFNQKPKILACRQKFWFW